MMMLWSFIVTIESKLGIIAPQRALTLNFLRPRPESFQFNELISEAVSISEALVSIKNQSGRIKVLN